ncbi:MAG: T9SS type A sorting domain-containing protein [Adhaeribacter sp.]
MKKLPILILLVSLLGFQTAFSQDNGNGYGIDNGNNGNGNGNGVINSGNNNGNGIGTRPGQQVPGEDEMGLITLPVKLTSFEAKAATGLVALNWATATEENNQYFEVERSQDGKNFTAIGRVSGKGTTQQAQQYSFKDVKPLNGTLYYRLKQVDLDGTSELSAMKAVTGIAAAAPKLAVYPNPVVSDLHMELNTLPQGNYTITLSSMSNGVVKQKTVQAGELLVLNVSDIPSGAYILTISGNDFKQTNKFFKR